MKPPYAIEGIPTTNGNRLFIRTVWSLINSRRYSESFGSIQTNLNRLYPTRTDMVEIIIKHYQEQMA